MKVEYEFGELKCPFKAIVWDDAHDDDEDVGRLTVSVVAIVDGKAVAFHACGEAIYWENFYPSERDLSADEFLVLRKFKRLDSFTIDALEADKCSHPSVHFVPETAVSRLEALAEWCGVCGQLTFLGHEWGVRHSLNPCGKKRFKKWQKAANKLAGVSHE